MLKFRGGSYSWDGPNVQRAGENFHPKRKKSKRTLEKSLLKTSINLHPLISTGIQNIDENDR